MKPEHTRIAAIAMVAVALVAVIFKLTSPATDSQVGETPQALHDIRAERLEASRAKRHKAGGAVNMAHLKKQLLEEFPNLRSDPPIPDEQNPIYQLNELLGELTLSDDDLRKDLFAVIGEDVKWDLRAAQDLLEHYDWVIKKLDGIHAMEAGAYRFEGGHFSPNDSGGLMLLLDLTRLKIRTVRETEGFAAQTDHIIRHGGLTHIIQNSQGATMAQSLMAMPLADDSPANAELYQNLTGSSIYAPFITLTWHVPYWGKDLSSQTLAREIRDLWWNNIEQPNPFSPYTSEMNPDTARVFAQHVSSMLTRLETENLDEFINSGFPEAVTKGLHGEQKEIVAYEAEQIKNSLQWVIAIGLAQHQESVAIHMRDWEAAGHDLMNPVDSPIPLQPITRAPYAFDPETRMLSRTTQIEGCDEVPPTRIHRPGKGGIWNTLPSPFDLEEEEEP